MATRIRLRRVGRKKVPLYRIVVADGEAPRDGRFIEVLGTYDPKGKTAEKVEVDAEKAKALDREGRDAVGDGRSRCFKQAGVFQPAKRVMPDAPTTSAGRAGCGSRTG